ncbi:hypothetical protein ACFYWS_36440 [Streptomyces sp. NPDC002795]|uniref:hypothetical protein n=1 Tax=Streptomyces sp. NPDC002795 TaxID=3364665 RepID=UPI00367CA8DC
MAAALAGGVLGIDHDADHLAAWRLHSRGNPVSRPHRIDVDCRGATSRRDARIRHACTTLIRTAKESGATALVIEDLGFDTGRETRGRRFRRHWQKPTSSRTHEMSGRQAAAIVIGRRGQGLGARRRGRPRAAARRPGRRVRRRTPGPVRKTIAHPRGPVRPQPAQLISD